MAALTAAEKRRSREGPSTSGSQQLNHAQATEVVNSIFMFESAPPSTFSHAIEYLYNQCSQLDGAKFPPLQNIKPSNYTPDNNIVQGMITVFQESLPEEVAQRHLLNADRAAEDLARTLRKAAKEYMKTLE